jgi:hypothetical protein
MAPSDPASVESGWKARSGEFEVGVAIVSGASVAV